MSLTINWAEKVVEASASITDLVAFHADLRLAEGSPTGMLSPVIHQWRALALGGGSFFYQIDFINGWTLKFPNPGSYTIVGNLNTTILPVADVYVERKTSASFTTVSSGSSGPTAESIAAALVTALKATSLPSDLVSIRGRPLQGTGAVGDEFGVSP